MCQSDDIVRGASFGSLLLLAVDLRCHCITSTNMKCHRTPAIENNIIHTMSYVSPCTQVSQMSLRLRNISTGRIDNILFTDIARWIVRGLGFRWPAA